MTNHNRKSKGYGFIQFTDVQMAVLAVEKMNGFVVGQNALCVKLADRDKDRGIFNQPSTNLYVSNLPKDYGVSEISVLFAPYGSISSMVVLTDGHNGGSRGVSLVRYYSIESASTAIAALHGRVIPGHDRPLEVKFAENQEEKHLRKSTVHRTPVFNSKQRGGVLPRRESENKEMYGYPCGTRLHEHSSPKEKTPEQLYQQHLFSPTESFESVFSSEEILPKDLLAPSTDGVSAPLHVYGIDPHLNELELYKLFAPFGAIVSVKMEDTKSRRPLFASVDDKCCVVQFRSNAHALEAVKGLNGATLNGKLLTVVNGELDPSVSLLPAGA